jgi:hypothetical protein
VDTYGCIFRNRLRKFSKRSQAVLDKAVATEWPICHRTLKDLAGDDVPFWKEARLQAIVDLDKWELNNVVLRDISARRWSMHLRASNSRQLPASNHYGQRGLFGIT